MMKKSLVLALFGLFLIAPLAFPPPAGADVGFRRDIRVAPGETQDKIFSLGGNVLIEGKVLDDVMVIGGSITISGEAGQSVIGIGSRIIVKSTARIGEDLAVLGGTLEKEPGCAIAGDTIYFQTAELGDKLFKDDILSSVFSMSLIPIVIAIKLVIIFLWLMVAVMGAALFPKPLAFASGEIRKSFWPAFGIGLVAIIVFSGLVLFAALLSIILVGIPVLLALIVAGTCIKVFGRLAVLYFLGDSALRALGSKRIYALGAVLIGLLVFSFIGFIPIFGFFFGFVMNAVGWGIALRTKFGTRENWFHKKPAC
jgi:hypothetical protein